MKQKSNPNKSKKIVARKTEQKIELREKILDAAREMVLKNGYGDLSIRKLAEKIDYAPGTIYLYFENRDAIVREICLRGFSELNAKMQIAAKEKSEPKKRIIALLESYADFAVSNPETYHLSFMEDPKFTEEMFRNAPLETENGAGRQALQTIIDEFQDLKKNGKISETEDENLLAEVFWTAIHGIVSSKLIYPAIPFNSVEKLVEKTIQTLLKGLEK